MTTRHTDTGLILSQQRFQLSGNEDFGLKLYMSSAFVNTPVTRQQSIGRTAPERARSNVWYRACV